ncbi:MAG: mechanosensitive ion channel protein MscS [Proteobacteria bacterium]|nr:MAG: mechanosensitive ion channel protein MscS [Pseudomonadota bacterium]
MSTLALPRRLVLLVALALLAALPAGAQPAPASEPAAITPAPQPAPEDPYDRGTPRGAVEGFLAAARARDWARATAYLDLRGVRPAATDEEEAVRLAQRFELVLGRTLAIDLDALSDDPAGRSDDGLDARRDLVGRIDAATPPLSVYLERVAREDGVRIWKFSRATLREVPRLWEQFGDDALVEWLPEPLVSWTVFGLRLWQWIGLASLAFAAALLAVTAKAIAGWVLRPLMRRAPSVRVALAPLATLLGIALFSASRALLKLSMAANDTLGAAASIATLLVLTWLAFRLVDAAERRIAARLRQRAQPADVAALVLGRRAVKAAVGVLAALAILQNAGVNVTGLLAGLGVGGIAVALAAQKSLENLFGGLTIVADQPVRVGDFCRFGDKIGTVEEIGLRSTRVRTLERTMVTIPNSQFSSMEIENFARRDRFWYRPTLNLRYESTPDQIRWLLVALREVLYAHPCVDPNPARVRFVGLGASSLDLEVFAYVNAKDFDEFLEVAEDLNLRIMETVAKSGTGFAIPSQTLYVRPDGERDERAAADVEAEVARWRESGELALPRFSPERVRRLAGTLDYPPRGSVLRT